MARIDLITERSSSFTHEQAEIFDWIVASRGTMIRPFQVLMHSPEIARSTAELGAKIRFESSLDDRDRELVILTVGVTHGCAFVWDSHIDLAHAAGIRDEAITVVRDEASDLSVLDEREELLIGATRELCRSGSVSDERFAQLLAAYGQSGAVEFSATVGYYTMLGFVMGACDAC